VGDQDSNKLLQALDKSIEAAGKLARHRVDALRRKHPDLSDAQLLKKVNTAFSSAVTTTGAATGAMAAAPGVGTAISLVAAGGMHRGLSARRPRMYLVRRSSEALRSRASSISGR
jgi:hypothetical protein